MSALNTVCVAGIGVTLATASSLERGFTVWSAKILICVLAASMPAALQKGLVFMLCGIPTCGLTSLREGAFAPKHHLSHQPTHLNGSVPS